MNIANRTKEQIDEEIQRIMMENRIKPVYEGPEFDEAVEDIRAHNIPEAMLLVRLGNKRKLLK